MLYLFITFTDAEDDLLGSSVPRIESYAFHILGKLHPFPFQIPVLIN